MNRHNLRTQCTDRHRALIEAHVSLVRSIAASAYTSFGGMVDFDELVSFGHEGLVRAALRFDEEAGVSFASYAHRRIRGAMFDGVGTIAPMSRKRYRLARHHQTPPATAQMTVEPGASEPVVSEDQVGALQLREVKRHLDGAFAELSEDKRHLLRAHYHGDATLCDAGRQLGISRSWASRMHASALCELREGLERRGIRSL